MQRGTQMVATCAGTVDDPTCHAAQQEIDGPAQFAHPLDRGTAGFGHLCKSCRIAEPARVHGSGECLEICLSGEVVVEGFESLCGAEELRSGAACRPRTCGPAAAAGELHLCAHASDLGLLERGERRQLRYREKVVSRLWRCGFSFG